MGAQQIVSKKVEYILSMDISANEIEGFSRYINGIYGKQNIARVLFHFNLITDNNEIDIEPLEQMLEKFNFIVIC